MKMLSNTTRPPQGITQLAKIKNFRYNTFTKSNQGGFYYGDKQPRGSLSQV
jgi:hypothetical protein